MLELIDLAHEKVVILFCLPLYTTHALQPLNVVKFKPFKDQFFKSVPLSVLVLKHHLSWYLLHHPLWCCDLTQFHACQVLV